MTTIKAKCGYSSPRFEGEKTFRPMVAIEAQSLRYGQTLQFLDVNGNVRECRVSGNPKLWKTRPNHVRVPIKYGMYENSYAESYGAKGDPVTVGTGNPIIVEI